MPRISKVSDKTNQQQIDENRSKAIKESQEARISKKYLPLIIAKYEKRKQAIAKLAARSFQQKINDDPKRFEVLVDSILVGIAIVSIIGLMSLVFTVTFTSHFHLVLICLAIALLCMHLVCLYNQIKEDLEIIKKNEQEIVENQCKQVQEEEIEDILDHIENV